MTLSVSQIFFLMGLGFSLAAPIGPVNMEMLKQTLKSKFGWILGLLTGIGAMSGDFIIASSVLYVGSELLSSLLANFMIYGILVGLNVAILSFIGISALKTNPQISTNYTFSDQKRSHTLEISAENYRPRKVSSWSGLRQYVTGLGLVMSSPWSYLWWSSFFPYILNSGIPLTTFVDRLIVTIFFIGGIFVWVLLFCGVLGISNRVASPKFIQIIIKISAIIILVFAVKILNDGVCFLFNIGFCSL